MIRVVALIIVFRRMIAGQIVRRGQRLGQLTVGPKNDIVPQTGKTGRGVIRNHAGLGGSPMDQMNWLVALVERTIGAARGRAARGRPDIR